MLTINKKKVIFFHNKKTAGTSIEAALSILCDDSDYISFHSKEFEEKKKNLNLRKSQNNFIIIPEFSTSIYNMKYNLFLLLRKFFSVKSEHYKRINFISPMIVWKEKIYCHIDPVLFKKNKNFFKFRKYLKLTTYRKFSDQLYSMYNHRMQYSKYITYQKFCENNLEIFFTDVIKFYSKDLYFLDYENMKSSLNKLKKKLDTTKDFYKIYELLKFRTNYKKFPKKLDKKMKMKLKHKDQLIKKMVKNKII